METTKDTFEAYDVVDDIEALESSTAAMLAEVDSSIKSEEPVAFLAWRPHIMFSKYDIKILEDEKGIWNYDNVMPIANTEFADKAPEVYEFTNNFKITIDEIEEILFEVEEEDVEISELASEWFADNREVLDKILEKRDDN